MATAVSLTEQRIIELTEQWQAVLDNYAAVTASIAEIRVSLQAQIDALTEFEVVTVPQLAADVAAGDVALADLQNTTLANMQAALDANNLKLTDMDTVTIPALRADLDSTAQNVLDSPHIYEQPEPPLNPDINNRPLRVGDSWYDTDDNNKQYMWNGVEWSTFTVDINDFSLTAQKFKTNTHMIY